MITVTRLEQIDGINKYGAVVPQDVIDCLKSEITELDPNDSDFIWELHDGWRYVITVEPEVPDPEEYCVEHVEHIVCRNGQTWVSAMFIENNETCAVYLFPLNEGSRFTETTPEWSN